MGIPIELLSAPVSLVGDQRFIPTTINRLPTLGITDGVAGANSYTKPSHQMYNILVESRDVIFTSCRIF